MDAIGAVWLLQKFGGQDLQKAEVVFVKAGERLEDDEAIHVDTGLGEFDHHQPGNRQRKCATKLVYEYLVEKNKKLGEDEALFKLVDFINETDHFASVNWPEAKTDRFLFGMEEILAGLRSGKKFSDLELVAFGSVCYDGVYVALKMRVSAEKDLRGLGETFESKWGKSLSIENQNDEVMKLAMRQGYKLVVRKDKENGNVRIKAVPDQDIDLEPVYEEIKKVDSVGTWYFHPSRAMLLNGSSKRSDQIPTLLALKEVVEIIKQA